MFTVNDYSGRQASIFMIAFIIYLTRSLYLIGLLITIVIQEISCIYTAIHIMVQAFHI